MNLSIKGMKKIGCFLLSLAIMTSMAGCSGTGVKPSEQVDNKSAGTSQEKTIKVGLSWHSRQSAIVQAWEDYFKQYSEEYGKENGLKFQWIVTVADGDLTREASNIQDLINQDVDVIVAWAKDSSAIGSSISSAHDAGIKFVTFDHKSTSSEKPDAHVGADSYHQAITTAEEFAKILKEANVQGKVIELMGDLGDENALARSKGWKEIEEKTGQWKTIVQVPTEWKPEKFKSGLANALAAHPDANAIFLGSDFAFAAVQAALEEAGRWAPTGDPKHMWIATQDVMPQGYEGMVKGYIDVGTTYDAYNHAMELVKVIADLAQGNPTEEVHLVPGRIATPKNIESLDNMWSRDYKD